MNVGRLTMAILVLALHSSHALAHHGATAWDPVKAVTVTGRVVEFRFVNPHVLISIDVNAADATIERWHGELTNPISLARQAGWTKNTFKPGEVITLVGHPARNGATNMAITRVLSADGRQRYPPDTAALP